MTIAVIGPSSVGKSTFLKSDSIAALGLGDRPIVYGYQLARDEVPPRALIHYNLLHRALGFGGDLSRANDEWDFLAEPIFHKIITAEPEQALVLVSSLSELQQRMSGRRHVEEHLPNSVYDRNCWLKILSHIDLFRLYEMLFDALAERRIPFRVFYSSQGRFEETDRIFTHAHLEGWAVRLLPRQVI